jgi:hypothetical protein
MRVLNFTLGLLLVALPLAYANHGSWIDHFRQANGQSCCQKAKDCITVKAAIVERGKDRSLVVVDGIRYEMPTGSIHISEDEEDWFCRVIYPKPYDKIEWADPLCLFIAPKT